MTNPNKIPYGFWKAQQAELARCVNTMTNDELAAKFNVTKIQVMTAMTMLDIKREKLKPSWKSREAEMKQLSPSMTAHEMAKHFRTSADNMYSQLRKLGIVAVSSRPESRFDGGIDALVEAAATMPERQLCEKFGISQRTVRIHLKARGIKGIRDEHSSVVWDDARRAEIVKMRAEGKTVPEIAKHFDSTPKYIRKRMIQYGISTREAVIEKPRQPIVKKAKPRLPALPASRPGRIPGSAVRMPKPKPEPAQIIMPENVKMTISHFNPLANTRICNGSSHERYDPKARTVGARWGY